MHACFIIFMLMFYFYFFLFRSYLEQWLMNEPIVTNFSVLLYFSLFTDVLILVLCLELLYLFYFDDTLMPRPLEFDLLALEFIIYMLWLINRRACKYVYFFLGLLWSYSIYTYTTLIWQDLPIYLEWLKLMMLSYLL